MLTGESLTSLRNLQPVLREFVMVEEFKGEAVATRFDDIF
jgi:hypothetical protein